MRPDAIPDVERPLALAHRRFVQHRAAFVGLDVAQRFARIHATNLWGAETSVSGLGSEDRATASLRDRLGALLRDLEVRTLLDAPCGDAGWMRGVDLGGIDYVGVDIVPDLIAMLRARANPPGRYLLADLTRDDLPPADAILCRDCLVHLSFAHGAMAIDRFRRSGARWLIATTFTGLARNRDCEDGDWRPLNLSRAPFRLGPPATLLIEGCSEDAGGWADKALGVWPLQHSNR